MRSGRRHRRPARCTRTVQVLAGCALLAALPIPGTAQGPRAPEDEAAGGAGADAAFEIGMARDDVLWLFGEPEWSNNTSDPASFDDPGLLDLLEPDPNGEPEAIPDPPEDGIAPFLHGEEGYTLRTRSNEYAATAVYRADERDGDVVARLVSVQMDVARPGPLEAILGDLPEAYALCPYGCSLVGIADPRDPEVILYPDPPSEDQRAAASGAASWWSPARPEVGSWVPGIRLRWSRREGSPREIDAAAIDWLQEPIDRIEIEPVNIELLMRTRHHRRDDRVRPLGPWR